MEPRANGLEDVIAATTRLSDVDGEAGRLTIAGFPVESLAGEHTFEEAVFLLWSGRLPDRDEREGVTAKLGAAREAAFDAGVAAPTALRDPMDALRACVARLGGGDARTLDDSLRILGAVAVAAAGSAARPDPRARHAADYLRLATGAVPTAAAAAALDAYLVTVIDHGMNASTFAARVVASTASDAVSAVVAGIGALKGKLHGGAPGPVLDMLDAIGSEANARAWIDAELARGHRIMGMGHRIYRVRDPRAFVLERAIAELEKAEPATGTSTTAARLRLARAVEKAAEAALAEKQPQRPLRANVEFYTAVLLEAVGLPRELFTPTFAVSRAAGWLAHVEEQRATGKLIRPRSVYCGAVGSI